MCARSILVVEDEAIIRFDVADYLREQGFVVLEAGDADEALGILRANVAIDLVLSDIQMPGRMDGRELAFWIQANAPRIPVILVTGADPAMDVDLSQFGRIESKPYDLEALLSRIRAVLDT